MLTAKKGLFGLCVLFFVFALLATVTVAKASTLDRSSSGTSEYLRARKGSDLSEQERIKNVIETYFELRYKGQQLLEAQDFSFLVSDTPVARQWLHREADKREIEIYLATLYHLNYVRYKYVLDYDKIYIDEKSARAVVELRESHEVVFESIAPEVSRLANLKHIITLTKTNTGWKIVRDKYEDELTQLMAGESKAEILARIKKNYEDEIRKQQGNVATVPSSEVEGIRGAHIYNGWAAANYADTYWHYYNPAYTAYSNDCTNFVSQAIYEGTSHTMSLVDPSHYMDYWYYSAGNGSYPWINVTGLYNFLTTNSGRGPYGEYSYVCYMAKGDVIELYANGQGWFHAVIVAKVIDSGYCWDKRNILIDSHTTDRYHYPLSYYSAYGKRYIHITGWNN